MCRKSLEDILCNWCGKEMPNEFVHCALCEKTFNDVYVFNEYNVIGKAFHLCSSCEYVPCAVCKKTVHAGSLYDIMSTPDGKMMFLCSFLCFHRFGFFYNRYVPVETRLQGVRHEEEYRQEMLSAGKGQPCDVCEKVITDMPYEFMFRLYKASVKDCSGRDCFDINRVAVYVCSRECYHVCSRECFSSATGKRMCRKSLEDFQCGFCKQTIPNELVQCALCEKTFNDVYVFNEYNVGGKVFHLCSSCECVPCAVCKKTVHAGSLYDIMRIPDDKVMFLCSFLCFFRFGFFSNRYIPVKTRLQGVRREEEYRQEMLSAGKGQPCVVCEKVITDMPYEFMFRLYKTSVKDCSGRVRRDCFDINRVAVYVCSRKCHRR